MSRYVTSIIAGAVFGLASWFFGLPLIPSIVVGLVTAGVIVVFRAIVLPTDNREWPPPPPEPSDGTRHEVPELAWALRAPGGYVDDRIVDRIRSVVDRVLSHRHLDLGNPADRDRIERLVGAQVYQAMVELKPQLSLPALQAVLDSLERLEATDPSARG